MEINGADVNPSYPTFVSLEDMWKRLIGLNGKTAGQCQYFLVNQNFSKLLG